MNPSHRSKAREYALQALYQWHMAGADLIDIEHEFLEACSFKKVDQEYFKILLYGVPENSNTLDQKIAPLLDRKITELGPIELSILRIGTYELLFRLDVPYKVVINESVNLTKKFGATESHKYINGVLDKLARKLRVNEQ